MENNNKSEELKNNELNKEECKCGGCGHNECHNGYGKKYNQTIDEILEETGYTASTGCLRKTDKLTKEDKQAQKLLPKKRNIIKKGYAQLNAKLAKFSLKLAYNFSKAATKHGAKLPANLIKSVYEAANYHNINELAKLVDEGDIAKNPDLTRYESPELCETGKVDLKAAEKLLDDTKQLLDGMAVIPKPDVHKDVTVYLKVNEENPNSLSATLAQNAESLRCKVECEIISKKKKYGEDSTTN